MTSPTELRFGLLLLDVYKGRAKLRVTVLGETPSSYWVRFDESAPVIGVQRGDIRIVPRDCVELV